MLQEQHRKGSFPPPGHPRWPTEAVRSESRQNPHGIRFAICFSWSWAGPEDLRGARRGFVRICGGDNSGEDSGSLATVSSKICFTVRKRKLYAGERSQQQPVHRACRLSAWCPPFGPSATTNTKKSASSRNAAWPPPACRGRVAPAPEARRSPPPPSAGFQKPPTPLQEPPSARARLGGTCNREPRRSAALKRRP